MNNVQKSVLKLKPWTNNTEKVCSLSITEKEKELICNIFIKAYLHVDISYDMLGSRKRVYVETNAIIATVVKEYFNVTLSQVGKMFNKHHATILHYITIYEDTLCMDKKNRELYQSLTLYVRESIYGKDEEKSFNIGEKSNKELKEINSQLKSQVKILTDKINIAKELLVIDNLWSNN